MNRSRSKRGETARRAREAAKEIQYRTPNRTVQPGNTVKASRALSQAGWSRIVDRGDGLRGIDRVDGNYDVTLDVELGGDGSILNIQGRVNQKPVGRFSKIVKPRDVYKAGKAKGVVESRAIEQGNEQADLQELAGYFDDLFSVVQRIIRDAEWVDQYQRNVKGVGPLSSPLGKKYQAQANQVMSKLTDVADKGKLKRVLDEIGRLGKELDRVAWE